MAGQVLEPSFTMREVLGSDDIEQTYTAVADRCEGTTGRRQMAWYPGKNYGWCSLGVSYEATGGRIRATDKANYCDASHSEPPDGKGSATSKCCVEHDKCLNCKKTNKCAASSTRWGGSCDFALARCVKGVSCATVSHWWTPWLKCSWKGCRWTHKKHTAFRFDFECAAANAAIYEIFNPGSRSQLAKPTPNTADFCF